ncbi:hypothetical protein T439DRAFT_380454 [Meredithblackwellia eburnea MCA 4105]
MDPEPLARDPPPPTIPDNHYQQLQEQDTVEEEEEEAGGDSTATEEQDVCRVCRSGVEDGPLFYPCQCTGSIRYVHEPCLNEWLHRSGKDMCELCGTALTYTNVFSSSMPTTLPLPLLLRHILLTLLSLVVLLLRAALVSVSWLAILPYVVLWVFRFFIISADGVGNFIHLFNGRISPRLREERDVRWVLDGVLGNFTKALGDNYGGGEDGVGGEMLLDKEIIKEALEGIVRNLSSTVKEWAWSSDSTTAGSVIFDKAGKKLLGTTVATHTWVSNLIGPSSSVSIPGVGTGNLTLGDVVGGSGGWKLSMKEKEWVLRGAKEVLVGFGAAAGGAGSEETKVAMLGTTLNRIGNLTELPTLILEKQSIVVKTVEPWRRVVNHILADTFTGQIITSIVVVLFVFGFLAREFILMNGPFPPLQQQQQQQQPNNNPFNLAGLGPIQFDVPPERMFGPDQPPPMLAARELGLPNDAPAAGVHHDHHNHNHHEHENENEEDNFVEVPVPGAGHEQFIPIPGAGLGDQQQPFAFANVGLGEGQGQGQGQGQGEERRIAPLPSRASPSFAGGGEEEDGSAYWSTSEEDDEDILEYRRREERARRDERARRREMRRNGNGNGNGSAGSEAGGSGSGGPVAGDSGGGRRREREPRRRARPDVPRDVEIPNEQVDGVDPLAAEEDEWSDEEQLPPLLPIDFDLPLPAPAPAPALAPPPPPPILALPLANPLPQAPAPAPQIGEDAAGGGVFAEDEFEGEGLDDFDGVLEAIGMKGPLLVLVQNMGLMNLLISLCLGGAVWIPLCIGKILAASDAIRLFTLPLRAVRSISDPIFDVLFNSIKFVATTLLTILGKSTVIPAATTVAATANDTVIATSAALATQSVADAGGAATIFSSLQIFLRSLAQHYAAMAFEDTPFHRALCVGLGYVGIIIGGAIFLHSSRDRHSFGTSARDVIVQQLVLGKVIFFVFIEIIIFPLTCGIVLNLATLPLFPHATILSRISVYASAPVSTIFLTWLAGTAFMFQFSCAVDHVRDVVRDGVLFFIRDPANSEFSPIREILERNSATQAKKIAISAVLYSGAIFLTIGTSVYFLRYAVGILPLRWSSYRPFFFPVDLVLYRFIVPLTLRLVDPGSRVKRVFTNWAKYTASQLRLTSFIFGGERKKEEEGSHVRRTWRAKLLLKKASPGAEGGVESQVSFQPDGSFARVPAVDNIRVMPGRRMIIPVDESGRPLDDEGGRVIQQQVLELQTTRKTDKYEIVYLPPHFKTRVALFIYLLWFTGSFAGMSMVVLPLIVGRYLFSLLTPTPVHDIYALCAGLYTVVGLSFAVRHFSSNGFLSKVSLARIKTFWSTLATLLVTGVVLPLLTSLFVSSYVVLPLTGISLGGPQEEAKFPVVRIFESWGAGTMMISTAYNILITPWGGRYRRRVEEIRDAWVQGGLNGARPADAPTAMQLILQFLWRPTCWLAITVFAPGIAAAVAWWIHSVRLQVVGWTWFHLCRASYRLGSVCLAAALLASRCHGLAQKWLGSLREAEYLIERRLRNYEGATSAPSPANSVPAQA